MGHAEIYLAQIESPTFLGTTKDFQKSTVLGVAEFLNKAIDEGEELTYINGMINFLNDKVLDKTNTLYFYDKQSRSVKTQELKVFIIEAKVSDTDE